MTVFFFNCRIFRECLLSVFINYTFYIPTKIKINTKKWCSNRIRFVLIWLNKVTSDFFWFTNSYFFIFKVINMAFTFCNFERTLKIFPTNRTISSENCRFFKILFIYYTEIVFNRFIEVPKSFNIRSMNIFIVNKFYSCQIWMYFSDKFNNLLLLSLNIRKFLRFLVLMTILIVKAIFKNFWIFKIILINL